MVRANLIVRIDVRSHGTITRPRYAVIASDRNGHTVLQRYGVPMKRTARALAEQWAEYYKLKKNDVFYGEGAKE